MIVSLVGLQCEFEFHKKEKKKYVWIIFIPLIYLIITVFQSFMFYFLFYQLDK